MFGGVAQRSPAQVVVYITDGPKNGSAIPILAWLFSRYLPYNNRMQGAP